MSQPMTPIYPPTNQGGPNKEQRTFWENAKRFGDSILHFTWTQAVLYWIILSAGTMSECAFLIASMWMSENSAAHPLVRKFLSEDATQTVSWFATAAYVGLPVAILPLAILTVIKHARMWAYDQKKLAPKVWCILYGLPTAVFLTLDIFTVACSVLSVNFELPGYLVVARALSAYMFALVALLYMRIGKEQEADRLKEKDDFISELVEQARVLSLQIEALKAELEGHKRAIESEKAARKEMLLEMQQSDDMALQAYGDECIAWLRSGIKTASVSEITRFTGHSKRKIINAIASTNLQVSPRNKDLVLVSSLIQWLKNTPPPAGKTETEPPALHLVNE